MCLHPDVQTRAQKEIEEVIGFDRLPTAEDEQKLPYVGGLVKEILRYWTIAPLGALIYSFLPCLLLTMNERYSP